MSHIDDIKTEVASLPEYKGETTKEEDDAKRGRIKDQQIQIATQLGKKASELRIFCFGCRRQLGLHYMFRCLYCGEYYCKLCAQLHFGERLSDDKL